MPLEFNKYHENISKHELEQNSQVVEFLHEILMESPLARDAKNYLIEARGLNEDTLRDFKLGYLLRGEVLNIPRIFENRIIIPIHDHYGNVIALSSRSLDSSSVKYLHLPFKSSEVLFSLHRAKDHIIFSNLCYIVEGFFDVMSLWGGGVRNVVAVMGARLNRTQASLLLRYTKNIAWVPDHDEVGQLAAKRCHDLVTHPPFHMAMKIIKYPSDYKDIDEFIKSKTEAVCPFLCCLKKCRGFADNRLSQDKTNKIKQKMDNIFGRFQCVF